MKFCYLDESGTGDEPYAIMVGIIVDSQRMHVTKQDWDNLLQRLSRLTGRDVSEIHTRDFYSGNGPWRGLTGPERSQIITEIFQWLNERRHKISFCGIDKEKYFKDLAGVAKLQEMNSYWCMMALHQILIVQKSFQKEEKNKGNTVLIFDNEVTELVNLLKVVKNPPPWTDVYYKKGRKQARLDQIIDVPYFGDSVEVNLLQIADFIAYFLRRYVEIVENKIPPRYPEEQQKVSEWINIMLESALPVSSRYVCRGADVCSQFFCDYAPESLKNLGR